MVRYNGTENSYNSQIITNGLVGNTAYIDDVNNVPMIKQPDIYNNIHVLSIKLMPVLTGYNEPIS